ncbi:MAG TPA: transporter substrate-binding domain-containing protein, partial [Anaeromyxobacteraceae bacterium]|nr:transporter substrate-binding domain-containing protein [Anaeromyxobacteraceae bacterium]
DWVVTGTPQSLEAYGCMMRTGDARFKRLVDATLARVMTSGEAEAIYRKWFHSPIPPRGLNLNFPLSDAMRKLYQAPDDRPFD